MPGAYSCNGAFETAAARRHGLAFDEDRLPLLGQDEIDPQLGGIRVRGLGEDKRYWVKSGNDTGGVRDFKSACRYGRLQSTTDR
jgi:hypothetical protein